jgi:hypothetical protein
MIIDFKADRLAARRYRVLHAETGERLDIPRIWYADDVAGVIRHYVLDEEGKPRVNALRTGYVWEERRLPIRIVMKPPDELAEVDASDRQFEDDAAALKACVATLKERTQAADAEILRN